VRRPAVRRLLRGVLVLAAAVLGIVALSGRWSQVRAGLHRMSLVSVLLAALAVLAGLFATQLSWRALLADLGSPLPVRPALRVFFLGQLGKYLPGSVWSFAAQAELGRDFEVPVRRSAAVGVLAVAFSLASGLLVAAVTLPLLSRSSAAHYWPALALVPLAVAGLHPRVLNAVLTRVLRWVRRPALEHPLTLAGVIRCVVWAVLAWVAFGLQIVALAHALGAHGGRLWPLAIGGFALAWSVGFLVLFVPAGVGVREAALTAALAPVLPAGEALVVALVSRLLMTGGDLVWAVLAGALTPRRSRPAPEACDRLG